MFDPEAAIAAWRRQMGKVPSEALDELEEHLRDAMEAQERAGLSREEAFQIAVEALGQAMPLKEEFAKVNLEGAWRQALSCLIGAPEPGMTMTTASYPIEPRWATYLKGAVFLVPALLLWTLTAVFVVPKLQQICASAGLDQTGDRFWAMTEASIRTTIFFVDHGFAIFMASAAVLFLLEWRSPRWARYRRATIGVTAFALNTVVLISLFVMIVAALIAAPAMVR